jgi:hypothetical protein
MAKRKVHRKAYSQCDHCAVGYCRESQQNECAKGESLALADGSRYVCPCFDEGYFERLCA